ncbi:MAG TPA: hypothetical protein PLG14_04565 [Spirochaetales bacterium]|nr:hypothetical protein [Spirochaetales bacterium]
MPGLEIFGTAASLVIAASLMMRNLKRLRLINLAGSLMFALYGLGIKSLPVFLVNVFIVLIDAWYLRRLRLEVSAFSLLRAAPGDSAYLAEFLRFYAKDIARHVPGFSLEGPGGAAANGGTAEGAGAEGGAAGGTEAVFVLRDLVPASLVVYRKRGEGVYDILLDYAVPASRDYKSAEFFFDVASKEIAGGAEARFYTRSSVPVHERYLKRLGFVASDKGGEEAGPKGDAKGARKGPGGQGREYARTVRP